MPKVPRAATTRVRDAAIPLVPGTPISRRLRSRAAPSFGESVKSSYATDSSRQNVTTTDFDSDSDDFVLKKPKSKPKTRKMTKKPKSNKTSLKNILDTEPGETSQESDAKKKRPSNSEDLDTQSDASGMGKTNAKNPMKLKNDVAAQLGEIGENFSTRFQAKKKPPTGKMPVAQTQSSSEEYKTPESGEKNPNLSFDLSSEDEVPDILQESGSGNIRFITKTHEMQQIEAIEKKRLFEVRKRVDEYIRNFKMESGVKTLELSKVFGNVLLCDILEQLGSPTSITEMSTKLVKTKVPSNSKKGKLAVISEDSEVDNVQTSEESDLFKTSDELTPKSKEKISFPRPNEQGAITPPPGLHSIPASVFNFGEEPALASANKMVRLAKPGEVFYSERGSPILPAYASGRSVADSAFTQHVRGPHTIEVADTDGEKIKVDFVLRSGAPEKAKFFAEFITDVRGIAATRSTVKHNRIQAPRVPAKSRKGVSSSAAVAAANRRRP